MAKKAGIIGIAVVGLLATALVVQWWQRKAAAAELEAQILSELKEDDIKLILENEEILAPPLSIEELRTSQEARSGYLQRLRDTLALAAQARREGFCAKAEFEILREMGAKASLAHIYQAREKGVLPMKTVTKDEIQEFFKDSKNEDRFLLEVKTQLAARRAIYMAENKNDPGVAIPTLQGEELDHARERWARAAIVAQKARADTAFMQRREVQLQLKLQEARLLATSYLSLQLAANTEPSADEIAAYLAAHPEYDVNKKRQKAELVLQRSRGGEDFVKLVREFNELPLNKDKDGLYEDVDEKLLFPEVREVAGNLEQGEVADRLAETVYGYHVIKLESRKVIKDKAGNETISLSLRQIVIRNKFQAPTSNALASAPFEEAEAIAREALKEVKRKRLKAELAARNGIRVPMDITV